MLATCLAQFKPIIEVFAIKLNASVTPHARDGSLGDQVADRGWAAPDVLRCGRHVQQPTFVPLQRRTQAPEDALGYGVGESIQTLISRTCHRYSTKIFIAARKAKAHSI